MSTSGLLLWTVLIYAAVLALGARRACAGQQVCAELTGGSGNPWLLLDNLDTCVCVSRFDTGEILYGNKKLREEFGLKEVTGQICWQVLKEGAAGPCATCPRYTGNLREGSYYMWESYNSVTKKHYKNIDSLVTWNGIKAHMQHFVDITERMEAELALAKSKKNLEAALENSKQMNDAKSEFLSRMSHEIRTPMNAVVGMTKIAKQSRDASEIANCLDNIDISSKQLMAIINDIFDVSKIEAKKLELVSASFNFKRTMSAVYDYFKNCTDEKKQQFTLRLDDTIRTMYVGDEARLSQVVGNLLSNAVKFTPENGRIVFSARQKECAGGTATVEISVSDSGIGISKDNIVKLFSPFEQVDGSKSRKYGGTGLGLVLSKNIVALMDGKFSVKSEEGKGSVFSFTAKFAVGNEIPEEILQPEIPQPRQGGAAREDFPEASPAHGADNDTSDTHDAYEADGVSESGGEPAAVKPSVAIGDLDFSGFMPFVNVKRGLENLKGNGKLYAVLLRSYQKNDYLDRIRNAVSDSKFKEALQVAQALKSIAVSIGLDDLRTKMEMLEESLRSLVSDEALLYKLEISTEEACKLIPRIILVLEEGRLS